MYNYGFLNCLNASFFPNRYIVSSRGGRRDVLRWPWLGGAVLHWPWGSYGERSWCVFCRRSELWGALAVDFVRDHLT